jgi:hypothetical protein
MKHLTPALTVVLLATPAAAGEPSAVRPPVPVQAGGRPLDVEHVGHAAPFVGDFFEDGTRALLVGQYHEGRLRIYRNTGTRARPRFDSYVWFRADGRIASVPVG